MYDELPPARDLFMDILIGKMEAIRDLHPVDRVMGVEVCGTCIEQWPCKTMEVIDG